MELASKLRKIVWPIESHENKKFIPMALMMFCILLNYSTLRSIKDAFVVINIGPEVISFLKTYVVLPSAVLSMIVYTKLYNVMSQRNVFYTITWFFVLYLAFFALILYPYPDFFHPDPVKIANLSTLYPNFKWFIRIAGKWTLVTFYVISELWGSIMLSLLFWQFANQITKTEEAKRFYSMFGLLGNASLPVTAILIDVFLAKKIIPISAHLKYMPIFVVLIISGVLIAVLYGVVNRVLLEEQSISNNTNTQTSAAKKNKVKLSLGESFKMILTSKYLGLIAMLILSYGISINIVEGIWKSKLRELYTTEESYTIFMGHFHAYQGITSIFFMIIGSNILRHVSWKSAAMITPIMILVTGTVFFTLILFSDDIIANHLMNWFSITPLAMAVAAGTIQNVLSKATKYSLFDSTKEMSYIPLDDELKSKGKAAVDVIGGRFGKSGGGVLQSSFFILFPTFTFADAIPYFGVVFFAILIVWLHSVNALNIRYQNQLKDQNY